MSPRRWRSGATKPSTRQSNGPAPATIESSHAVPDTAPIGYAFPGTLTPNEGGTAQTIIGAVDPNGDNIFFSISAAPQHGSLQNFPDPSTALPSGTTRQVTYLHDGTENFTDFFEFSVRDVNGEIGSNVRVAVNINPINDNAPTAGPGVATVAEGAGTVIALTGSDADGDTLAFAIAAGPTNGSLGAITKTGGQTAQVTYTHNGSETTGDSFTFTVNDGATTSAPAKISITVTPVNDNLPVANNGTSAVDEGSSVEITLTGSDGDGDDLTFAIDTNSAHGSLSTVAQIPGQTAKVTYRHDGSETIADSFTFTANDGATTSAPATVSITVRPVNDPPTANDDTGTVNEDSGFANLSVIDNDQDPENNPITVIAVTQPANGTTQITGDNQDVRYRPDSNYCNNPPGTQQDTFTYTVNGGDTAQVRIRVNCQDDPLVAKDQSFLVQPDKPLTIDTVAYVDDPDGDIDPSSVEVSKGPSNGSVSVNTSSAKITYVPDSGYIGPDSFDYTICDTKKNCDTGRFDLFISVIDLRLLKDDDGVTVRPGELLFYTLKYENRGNAPATGVVISETVPVNTVFDAAASSGSWSCGKGAVAGTTCRQTIGRVDEESGGSTVFAVRLLAPLSEAAAAITNRATISANSANGPELTPADNVAEEQTPIDAGIDFNATKVDGLLVDANEDLLPGPGDTLRYAVAMTVTGNAPAGNVVFMDPLDPATVLVGGSVAATTGTILDAENAVEIALGDLAQGTVVAIRYDVRIRNPLPAGISSVANQGVISGSNFPAAVTDDPDTPQPADATVTFLEATAALTALKSVAITDDADGNDVASPGDTLAYTLTLISTGNQAVDGIVVADAIDPNTDVVAGSLTTSSGTILSGDAAGDDRVTIDVGTLNGGGDATRIVFQVRIKDSVASDVDEIVNQARVSSDSLPDVLSDDLAFGGANDPTRITVNANAKVFVSMQDFFVADVDGNRILSSGDLLFYRVEIFNNGNRNAADVVLENTFNADMQLLPGTVSSSSGEVVNGNDVGDDRVRVTIASLPGGQTVLVSYQVRIGDTSTLTVVRNQASVRYLNNLQPIEILSDDPTTTAQPDPTISPVGAPSLLDNQLYLPIVTK